MAWRSRKEWHNHQAVIRWLTRYPDRFVYGSPDATVNMEALPKPTSRVLLSGHGYRVLEEDRNDYWYTDTLLERALAKLHDEEWPLWMALAEAYIGDSANTSALDTWSSSGDPMGILNVQRVNEAIRFIMAEVADEWLKVPYDDEDVELREPSADDLIRARRMLAAKVWADLAERYEKDGMRPDRASGAATRRTAEIMGYSRKEVYKIIKEVK